MRENNFQISTLSLFFDGDVKTDYDAYIKEIRKLYKKLNLKNKNIFNLTQKNTEKKTDVFHKHVLANKYFTIRKRKGVTLDIRQPFLLLENHQKFLKEIIKLISNCIIEDSCDLYISQLHIVKEVCSSELSTKLSDYNFINNINTKGDRSEISRKNKNLLKYSFYEKDHILFSITKKDEKFLVFEFKINYKNDFSKNYLKLLKNKEGKNYNLNEILDFSSFMEKEKNYLLCEWIDVKDELLRSCLK
ncbi:MAG: hypothetical protein ACOCP8_00535 [archaeon]